MRAASSSVETAHEGSFGGHQFHHLPVVFPDYHTHHHINSFCDGYALCLWFTLASTVTKTKSEQDLPEHIQFFYNVGNALHQTLWVFSLLWRSILHLSSGDWPRPFCGAGRECRTASSHSRSDRKIISCTGFRACVRGQAQCTIDIGIGLSLWETSICATPPDPQC